MNIYVAARDFDWASRIMGLLRSDGHRVFDWTKFPPGHRDPAAAVEMRSEVLAADALVLVGTETGMLGAYLEVGMALAQHKPVVLHGATRDSLFWRLPNVIRTNTDEDLLEVFAADRAVSHAQAGAT